jgi:hypothetical protein
MPQLTYPEWRQHIYDNILAPLVRRCLPEGWDVEFSALHGDAPCTAMRLAGTVSAIPEDEEGLNFSRELIQFFQTRRTPLQHQIRFGHTFTPVDTIKDPSDRQNALLLAVSAFVLKESKVRGIMLEEIEDVFAKVRAALKEERQANERGNQHG